MPLDIEFGRRYSHMRAPIQDGELEYEIQGDGEPILFIHGGIIDGDAFRPLFDEPSLADYRLITYHRRGFAGSPVPPVSPDDHCEQAAADAVALLEYIGEQRAHVVGYSSGGTIALQLVRDAPEVVDSLILLEPGIPSDAEPMVELEPFVERYHQSDLEGAVEELMQEFWGEAWRTELPSMVPGGVEQIERDVSTLIELELPALEVWEFDAEKTEAFSRPILYLRRSERPSVDSEIVQSWFPQTEDHVVACTDHTLQMKDPQPVAEAIANFLRRQRP